MSNWDKLDEPVKEEYEQRAQYLIEKGFMTGDVQTVARMIETKLNPKPNDQQIVRPQQPVTPPKPEVFCIQGK